MKKIKKYKRKWLMTDAGEYEKYHNRYHNMPEENKQKLKEHKKN